MLGDIELDDLRFQELVSEARTRIVRHSPDWTEHNVSDPGITLIELFAWFTDVLLYRINRVPERLQLALLELVGITPAPPRAARTALRFVLEPSSPEASIPAGTAAAAPRTSGEDPIVFQTTESLSLAASELAAKVLTPTISDEALLVGFDRALSHDDVLRLEIDAAPVHEVAGDASVTWETSVAGGAWLETNVIGDETDGLRLGSGAVTLALQAQTAATVLGEYDLHWLRCRASWRPEIRSLRATLVGASVEAVHAATVVEDSLGVSEGIAGVAYPLRHRPVLALEASETLEVRVPGSDEWLAWTPVASFARSTADDQHFLLDRRRGEVRFGPAIRQPDGGWRQFGAIPPAGAALRFSRYRYGGGRAGNVAAGALMLTSPLVGVASVTNPRAASGGADAESLESARRRASLELHGRSRAVTAEDFERLTATASPRVARTLCGAQQESAPIRVHVIPRVEAPDRLLTLAELIPDEELMKRIAERLERHRLIGTSILLLPARLRAVSVAVEVQAAPLADVERVRQDVEHALYTFLNPLIGGSSGGFGAGWPAGRGLNIGELFGIVYGIDSVQSVNLLRAYETDLRTGGQAAQPAESHVAIGADELIASGRHLVRVVPA